QAGQVAEGRQPARERLERGHRVERDRRHRSLLACASTARAGGVGEGPSMRAGDALLFGILLLVLLVALGLAPPIATRGEAREGLGGRELMVGGGGCRGAPPPSGPYRVQAAALSLARGRRVTAPGPIGRGRAPAVGARGVGGGARDVRPGGAGLGTRRGMARGRHSLRHVGLLALGARGAGG